VAIKKMSEMEIVKHKSELEEKIKSLETEKTTLHVEIEALKLIPQLQTKLTSLEAEVIKLREEKKRLQDYARFTAE
jgi:predicted nuclease with TOPRIM domain